MNKPSFYKYRPLLGAFITGAFYCWFTLAMISDQGLKLAYINLMLFMPGITFPLSTSYYRVRHLKYDNERVLAHFVLSVAIYHASVWLFSAEGRYNYIPVFAGFFGCFMYLLTTKWLLNVPLKYLHILLAALLSGLVFLPVSLDWEPGLGWALFGWNMINGLLLTYATRGFYTSTV